MVNTLKAQPAAAAAQGLQRGDFGAIAVVAEAQPGGGQLACTRLGNQGLCQGVAGAVEVGVAGLPGQRVAARGYVRRQQAGRRRSECEPCVIELRLALQFSLREVHQQALKAVAGAGALTLAGLELFLHRFVKVLQQQLPRLEHGGVDLA
jgi:hypothetical protein